MSYGQDFREVAHTGGKATFDIECDAEGRVRYAIGYTHSAPTPATLCAIYAHPDGFACGNVKLGVIGQPFNEPPFPNCVVVFMASDSLGQFGHECPRCKKRFRSSGIPAAFRLTCPYCGLRTASFQFLTPPQRRYVEHYVKTLDEGLQTVAPNSKKDLDIDMDALADAITGQARPDFYYSSTTQQTQFRCAACNSFNDILGRYGYCASCGWRNNRAILQAELQKARDELNAHSIGLTDAVKKVVSEFDSCARNYVDHLVSRIPMKAARRDRAKDLLFHNIERVDEVMRSTFDINLLKSTGDARDFIKMMFNRRHAYEHNGGVATARYLSESGDASHAEGMLIRENVGNVHRLIDCLLRMTETLDVDFHEIFPPEPFCIEIEKERKARLAGD